MVTTEVAIKPNVRVVMESDTEHLDEVMVVAFGTAKKSQFTGSAATIKADKIAERQVSNVSNALSGQIAGVQTTATNGEPGAAANVRIRGIGSMSASNAPLYVVDGVPFEGNISTINPQDIETMTVLKDAASNALYGARGANGVILITTKKGQSGSKAKIDVDAKWGTNRRAIPNYDVMTDANTYYETYYQGINNALGGNAASDKVGAYVEQFLGYPIYNIPEGEQLFTAEGKSTPTPHWAMFMPMSITCSPTIGTTSCSRTTTSVRSITFASAVPALSRPISCRLVIWKIPVSSPVLDSSVSAHV